MAHLYWELANHLAQSIEKGAFEAGEKLPGVRATSRNEGVSPSTVVAAYRQLEREGYIEARPRSGFYVRPRVQPRLAEPATSRPLARPKPVSGQELVLRLVQNINTPDIVQLGANVPHASFLPGRAVNRALSAVSNGNRESVFGYEVPPGLLALRQQIAQRMVAIGCVTDPEDIVITSGCQEAVYLSLKSVTKPGDIVAIESPTYYGLLQAIDALGLKALEIPTHPSEGISIDALQLALEQWPVKACVVVPNFSNPLGALMPDEKKQALVALINRYRDVTLIEDDIYGDLNFEGKRPGVLKGLETRGNVIHCASHSKTLSAGLRIGWAISGKHAQQLAYEKFVSNCATSTVGQLTVAKFLQSGRYDRHLRTMKIPLMRNTARLIDRIGKHFPPGTRVSRPTGGMTLWLELDKRIDTTALSHVAFAQGISIAPGQIFSSSGTKYKNCLRLNCGVQWSERIESAVATLGKLAHELLPEAA